MLQIGKVGNFWALRLVKGADVLDSKVFKDEGAEMPNANKSHRVGFKRFSHS